MSFEKDLARLDDIVAELERDDVELDRALALFQEGVERLRVAQLTLVQTEAQVKQLVERADGSFTLSSLRD